jgi:hypothetical protein
MRKTIEIKIRNGNSKIGKDTFILNITSATDCPTKKLGLCKIPKYCYALQPELRWTGVRNVLKFRRKQTEIFDCLSASEIAKQIVEKVGRKKIVKIKYLRISEAGDFRSQEDLNKISEIADLLEKDGIRVYGYTARTDLNYSNISKNLVMNGSYFMVDNSFVPVRQYTEGGVKCQGNCRICNLCKEKNGVAIENKFHGISFNNIKEVTNGCNS